MKFQTVVEAYEKLEAIRGRIAITEILASLLKETPKEELPMLVYLTQGKLRPDYEGVELGIAEKLALRALGAAAGAPPDRLRKSYIELGDIGSAAQRLLEGDRQRSLSVEPLTLRRVYDTLLEIAKMTGQGSVDSKLKKLVSLLDDAAPNEAKYILRAAMGVLRFGVADYTILDACAAALLGEKGHRKLLERAYNVTCDLGYVVEVAAEKGLRGVEEIHVQVGKPIRPMLAERLGSAEAILSQLGGEAVMEYKLDGERVQIHKDGGRVDIFSRRIERITSTYPDVAEYAKKYVGGDRVILEGEVVAVNTETGEYLPFQELMHRRRKHGIEAVMKQYPVTVNFFDVMYSGRDYTNETYTVRRRELERIVHPSDYTRLVPARRAENAEDMENYMELAISQGCEGLVVKDPKATYRAGAREFAWIKLKREYRSELTDTIDLVIIGAFHGRGRRAGVYGTYLLAAYDKEKNTFPSITKVGTGFSDQDLERFPKLLREYESHVQPPNVESVMVPDIWYRPKIVIETIASEITLSPVHLAGMDSIRRGSGLALRFPKFTGKIRDEKAPEDATTVKEIIEIYTQQVRQLNDKPGADKVQSK